MACVHLPQRAALAMGHLVHVHVSCLSETRPADSLSAYAANAAVAPMRGHMREARGESAGDALRSLRREVRVGGVILRSAGCTIRSKTERQDLRRRGCEGYCLQEGGMGPESTQHASHDTNHYTFLNTTRQPRHQSLDVPAVTHLIH